MKTWERRAARALAQAFLAVAGVRFTWYVWHALHASLVTEPAAWSSSASSTSSRSSLVRFVVVVLGLAAAAAAGVSRLMPDVDPFIRVMSALAYGLCFLLLLAIVLLELERVE